MELVHFESKARSAGNYGGFLVILSMTVIAFGFAFHPATKESSVLLVPFGAVCLWGCCGYIYSFIKNPIQHFGIRDNTMWWDNPGWRGSAGSIPLEEVRKVRILKGPCELDVFMRDGSSRRISCPAAVETHQRARSLRDVLITNFPSLDVELIEGMH